MGEPLLSSTDAARMAPADRQHVCFAPGHGCGSKMGTPNGTLVNGNRDHNLRSPGEFMLFQIDRLEACWFFLASLRQLELKASLQA